MIKLSPRLLALTKFIPHNSSVIDIGCDHALLDIYLVKHKQVSKIIASDINENALANAKINIQKYQLTSVIETRLGNGLDPLTELDNIDTIVISGMGAHTIIGIIKNNLKKLTNINTIIIQSNTKNELLRKTMAKLNYIVYDEEIVIDNKKYYIIIKFIRGKHKYTKKELYFGPILLAKKTNIFYNYCQNELKKLELLYKIVPKNHWHYRYKLKKEIRLYKDI